MPNSPRARKVCGCSLRTSTDPLSGSSRPATRRNSVDFPQPDGPTMATKEPCATRSVTDASASVKTPRPRHTLLTHSMVRSSAAAPGRASAIRSHLREQRQIKNIFRSLESHLLERGKACVDGLGVDREQTLRARHHRNLPLVVIDLGLKRTAIAAEPACSKLGRILRGIGVIFRPSLAARPQKSDQLAALRFQRVRLYGDEVDEQRHAGVPQQKVAGFLSAALLDQKRNFENEIHDGVHFALGKRRRRKRVGDDAHFFPRDTADLEHGLERRNRQRRTRDSFSHQIFWSFDIALLEADYSNGT